MRVLLAISDLALHGAQKQVVELARELDRRGHAVVVYTLNDDVPRAAELAGTGVEVVVDQKRMRLDPAVLGRLRRKIRGFRAEIVHGFLYDADIYVRIAAIGPGTEARLRELHLQVDLMPETAVGSKIAKAFEEYESVENLRICLLRAEVANPDLPQALEKLGAIVDDIACYKTVAETEDPTGSATKLLESGADWITFTSASTVEHFHTRFDLPALLKQFPQIKLASIGPETSKALSALALEPTVEARQHTIEGLVAGLLKTGRQVKKRL